MTNSSKQAKNKFGLIICRSPSCPFKGARSYADRIIIIQLAMGKLAENESLLLIFSRDFSILFLFFYRGPSTHFFQSQGDGFLPLARLVGARRG
jgi:hypothetical protein